MQTKLETWTKKLSVSSVLCEKSDCIVLASMCYLMNLRVYVRPFRISKEFDSVSYYWYFLNSLMWSSVAMACVCVANTWQDACSQDVKKEPCSFCGMHLKFTICNHSSSYPAYLQTVSECAVSISFVVYMPRYLVWANTHAPWVYSDSIKVTAFVFAYLKAV